MASNRRRRERPVAPTRSSRFGRDDFRLLQERGVSYVDRRLRLDDRKTSENSEQPRYELCDGLHRRAVKKFAKIAPYLFSHFYYSRAIIST